MKTLGRCWLPVLILLGCLPSTGTAEDATLYRLRRNPFDFSAINPPKKVVDQVVATEEPTPFFELRATLVSARQSMANLNGEMLMVGDKIEGYRLQKIGENSVVLEKDGKKITVSIQ